MPQRYLTISPKSGEEVFGRVGPGCYTEEERGGKEGKGEGTGPPLFTMPPCLDAAGLPEKKEKKARWIAVCPSKKRLQRKKFLGRYRGVKGREKKKKKEEGSKRALL